MISIRSSVIRAVDYNPISRKLNIKFKNGRTYTYRNVPAHIFEGLMNATSAGSYFNTFIKDRYG